MADFILLMHDDAPEEGDHDWDTYLDRLKATGRFQGGSAIGGGQCFRKASPVPSVTTHLGGYIKVEARDMAEARSMLAGNPVYEAGGTVEIRELPRT
jgi:hypothetical protein